MEDIIIEHKEYIVFVVYSFADINVCKSFAANIIQTISECGEVIKYETIKAPLLRPAFEIFGK